MLYSDNVTCAINYTLNRANYASIYGIIISGDSLRLDFITILTQKNVKSRVYLIANNTTY